MKIICIGWNYRDHNKEMRRNDLPDKPIFFLKPDTALLKDNKPFFVPDFSQQVEYECELVYRINRIGKNIAERFAHRYYSEIALGIDFTARDLQAECRQKGSPWEIAKAFDNSATISQFIDLQTIGKNPSFCLFKNGTKVQEAKAEDMIFSIDKIIAYISKFLTLKIGDIIYTGTPAGVGKVEIGDRLQGFIGDREMFDFLVK
ncbi:2-hydroxyhepta-2,4-diene-1,7-dioate isomerase [Porphyromonadaceae bacterium COT-184 OH4590]|nr:2-hydroxyhepta-2,4-diene-1,7-dioate isomerase [Porphyromonadaceae bacterium COT-184 OH4590]